MSKARSRRRPSSSVGSVRPASSAPRRTNVVVDTALVERAKHKLGVRTTREAIQGALEALVRPVDYSELLAADGSGGIAEGYDPKRLYGNRNDRR